MITFCFLRSLAIAAVLSVISVFSSGVVQAQKATDFAIFSTDDVSLESYTVVRGDVYSGRDLNVEFGYGIQDDDLNAGSMFAFRNYIQGSLSDINGSVFTNGDATLEGSAEIIQNLTYGGVYNGSDDDVGGSIKQQGNSVGIMELPRSTQFSAGTQDIVTNASITLAPGSYRDLELTGSFDQINLTSGDYYFRRLDFSTGTTVSLQIVDNQPINVFLESDADFGSGLNFEVNGNEIGTDAGDSVAELARLVTFECHGDFTVPAGFLNYFFGTIFVPNGNVVVDANDMHGAIIAGRPIFTSVYLDFQPSNYLLEQAPPLLLGDCNQDGVVGFADISPFITALMGGDFLDEADFTGDQVVSFIDIAPFIAVLSSQN